MSDNHQEITEVVPKPVETPESTPEEQETTNQTEETEQIEQLKKELAERDSSLNSIVSEKLTELPESLQVLMPESLSVSEKLNWIEKAKAATPDQESVKEGTEEILTIGSSGRKVFEDDTVDTEYQKPLSATEKLSGYFSNMFSQ
ncbi:hypothetical protein [Vagococcus fluvialis]|uniref:hypothetical protein n=1 Tax=Vagococcus fluvialis TaxID=2738 RepID=UPI003B21707D